MVNKDYYTCFFNDDKNKLFRTNQWDKWKINFSTSKQSKAIASFKEEVTSACFLMYEDLYKSKGLVNLFFSGGMDSECLLRCFCELKIPVCPIVIIHHHEPNAAESLNALKVCEELNLKPLIFNLNLIKLFNLGVFHYLGLNYQTSRLGQVELLYVLDQIKAPCILADDIQLVNISRPENLLFKDESIYREWFYEVREDEDGLYDRYECSTNIPIVADPFRYTRESWASMISATEIKNLTTNKFKASSLSTKNFMMSKEFSVPYRQKTNVFSRGHHYKIAKMLKHDLSKDLLPQQIIRIPYKELLDNLI
jgi:hypothetical protein